MPIMKLATTQTSMDCVPVAKLVVDSMENAYSAKSREVNGECRNHFFLYGLVAVATAHPHWGDAWLVAFTRIVPIEVDIG